MQGEYENRAKVLIPQAGILPYSEKYSTWKLPGHGSKRDDCGTLRFRGCLNINAHKNQGLDRNQVGKAFIQTYRRTCMQKDCPICYESWAGKEAEVAEHRLKSYKGRWRGVLHLIASPSSELLSLSYPDLRKSCYKVLKKAGIRGGCVVFHPYRQKENKAWYFSPHFHILGYGWLNQFRDSGLWVIKNLGLRKSVFSTLLYQLSHAGVHKSIHTVTWFGDLSYNKLKVVPLEEERPKCPLCGEELRSLIYVGDHDPPDVIGDFAWNHREWTVKTLYHSA